jgi:hypothetical protein
MTAAMPPARARTLRAEPASPSQAKPLIAIAGMPDRNLYRLERAARAAEWGARRSEYPSFLKWHEAATYDLMDFDRAFDRAWQKSLNSIFQRRSANA